MTLAEKLISRWPSALVARRDFSKFSGGLYSAKTLANADCSGTGPHGAVRVGAQVAYPVEAAASWIISRIGVTQNAPRRREVAA
ncbi:hypothetical protein DGI_0003 [Megalodesulfovibrio gigas DSM 1382 = ATCC 19364]|uniref:Uncharacterized protein n=1 Tax=Megalodesulfovibrio gigas (strain ATCC 19364 / DSM 1382 / NCIMB 9332 / VKM B-1759) TaxID=1121448 RepID=T2G5T1_MEGG1|nr:hypothetical protein DGI_0003 [Megalodesulfovibrio gigas DSM 1382 = ATCC 19364]